MAKDFYYPIRVYIEDTDAGGIVFYVNYLKYMERSRTELFRLLGFEKPAMIDDGLLLVVVSANVQYKSPARLDDILKVSAELIKLGRSYLLLKQSVLRESQIICEAEIKLACVDQNTFKPRPLPGGVSNAINQYIRSSD